MSSGRGIRLGIAEFSRGGGTEMKIQNEKFPLSHFLRKAEKRKKKRKKVQNASHFYFSRHDTHSCLHKHI